MPGVAQGTCISVASLRNGLDLRNSAIHSATLARAERPGGGSDILV